MPPSKRAPCQNKILQYFSSAARSSNVTAHWRCICSSNFSSNEQRNTSLLDEFDAGDHRTRLSAQQSEYHLQSEQADQSNSISTRELSPDSNGSQSIEQACSENGRLFLADEEEDDHVGRLNEIFELASLRSKALGLSLIPIQHPTYEPMLRTPSALQKGLGGIHAETIEETANSPLDEFCEELCDSGDSKDENEVTASATKPFLFSALRMCPFVAKGLCTHAAFAKQRALSTHCRMKHQDENGKPIILTTVEEDPLDNGTAKIPCRWKCDRFFASYHAANDHAKKATTYCEKSEANVYPRPRLWSEVPGTECRFPPPTPARADSSHCTYFMCEDVLANTSQISIQD